MRPISSPQRVATRFLLATSLVFSASASPAADALPTEAIPGFDAIERHLDSLSEKPDAREQEGPKTDLPPGAEAPLVGAIQASDALQIQAIRLWIEDSSPYGVKFSGAGLLRLDLPKKASREATTADGVVFVTLSVKPALSSDPNQLSYVSVAGAVLGFGLEPPTLGVRAGRILVLNGGARQARHSDWFDAGISYPVNVNFEADMPLDLVLRIDAERGVWDLFFMQRLCYAGIFHVGTEETIWVQSAGAGATEVSELLVSADNPLFDDKDRDGIEDAVEVGLGFSAEEKDRGVLDELGQFTNLQHFITLRKTYPSRPQVDLEATLVEAINAEQTGKYERIWKRAPFLMGSACGTSLRRTGSANDWRPELRCGTWCNRLAAPTTSRKEASHERHAPGFRAHRVGLRVGRPDRTRRHLLA